MRLVIAVLLVLLAGCGDDSDFTPENSGPNLNNSSTNNVSTNNDTAPMMLPVDLQQTMDENCLSCHNATGIAPYDFTDIATVVSLGELIQIAVESRTMPPWNSDPDCVDLKGDLRLSADQIQIFGDWVAAGKPLVPEAPFERLAPKNPEIGDPPADDDEAIDMIIPEAYDPVFGRSDAYLEDDFRCFVVDPGFTQSRQMTGFEVLVDNPLVSHHMVVFTASGDETNRAKIAVLEDADPEPGFSCFGISGFNTNTLAAVWAPGGGRVGLPSRQGVGQTYVPIEAGELFVIQMHYNKPAADAGTDQSGIRMWFRPESEPAAELARGYWLPSGNEPFRIPAGVDGTNVPDDECDVVYGTYSLDGAIPGVDGGDEGPHSPPGYGYMNDEVECGIEIEDCENEFGLDAAECAIDYSTRLRVTNPDMAATYTVMIAGVGLTYDAAAAGATSAADVLDGIAAAINADASLTGIVQATTRDLNADDIVDEIVVANLDGEPTIRTEIFSATGEAQVWQRQVDGCSQWDPARMIEARSVGSSGCVQMDQYVRLPVPLKVWAAFSHMHLTGQSIETEYMQVTDDGNQSSPMTEPVCAARINNWDFNWQRTYWYEEPKTLTRDHLTRMRCRFNNSDSGEEIRLGDGSGAEMCFGLSYVTL